MRVIIILAAIALTHGAKLERAYLPPSSAGTAGGSGNFLQTPISGPPGSRTASARNYQNTPFGNEYSQFKNKFAQPGNNFAQPGINFAQPGKNFAQPGNNFAQPENNYVQPGNNFAQTGAEYNNVNFNDFASRPERPRAALERNAAILRQDSSNDGETFSYAFETENGIYAEEHGVATNGVEAQGEYSYTGDDGEIYSVRYTADQNGFVPQGDHLPTPPPVPEEILKALEQNARDEANGIYDDGSYNEAKYAGADTTQYNYQNAYNGNNDDAVVTNSAFRSGNARSFNNAPSNAYLTPNADVTSFDAPNTQAFNAPAPTYGATEARSYNANARGANAPAPTYGAPEDRSFNANARGANTPASTYGAPERSTNVAPTNNAPNAPSFNAASNRNAPSFNSAIFNAPNASVARNSATEKAYLPPFASQRGQARNAFGRRQSFNEKTGYKY